jgi:hydroxymethylpyrimidine kinase/phosphomethylpyrimidine kinase
MPSVLTIAGSDSSGRAGIQADLRTLAALQVHGLCAITAVTAQNARGVTALAPLEADLVTEQIEAAAADPELRATKIGMLATAAIVEAVAAAIDDLELPLVVLDPVIAASSGARLLDDDGIQTLLLELLPRVLVVTPNIPEAEALSGVRIGSLADARRAAEQLHKRGAGHVIIKGGHSASADVTDLLFDGNAFREFHSPRAVGAGGRGTGCSHASAVAAFLALGDDLAQAAAKAQQHVAGILKSNVGAAAHRT